MKIAIYSCNFGNYRNELDRNIDDIYYDENIDYFFFTELNNLKSKYWKIINPKLQDKLDFMNENRHTSKVVKFLVPDIIKQYDIIIWIDNKSIKRVKFKHHHIIDLVNKHPNYINFIKHHKRINCKQEINATIRLKLENRQNGNKFLNKIKEIKFKTILPDTKCIIYKNSKDNIDLFTKVYDTLIENKMSRDQNVIQYVLKKNNFEDKVNYFTFKELF